MSLISGIDKAWCGMMKSRMTIMDMREQCILSPEIRNVLGISSVRE